MPRRIQARAHFEEQEIADFMAAVLRVHPDWTMDDAFGVALKNGVEEMKKFYERRAKDEVGPRCPHGVRLHTTCRECDPTAFMAPKEIAAC